MVVNGKITDSNIPMEHKIIEVLLDAHPYERIKVELLPTNREEKGEVMKSSEAVENYLTLKLGAVKILETSPPFFLVRRVKE